MNTDFLHIAFKEVRVKCTLEIIRYLKSVFIEDKFLLLLPFPDVHSDYSRNEGLDDK